MATNRLKTQTTVMETDRCVRASEYSVHIRQVEITITILQDSVLKDSAQHSSLTEDSSALIVRAIMADSRVVISLARAAISRSSVRAAIALVTTMIQTATISRVRISMASVKAHPIVRIIILVWTTAISLVSRQVIVHVTITAVMAAISHVRTHISAATIISAEVTDRSASHHTSSAEATVSVLPTMIRMLNTA